MKKIAKEAWQMLRLNWRYILLFELLYRLLTIPLYLRLLNRGLRFSLGMAGYRYLTAANIGFFLIKPWTLAVSAVLLVIGTLLLTLEIAGLITAFEGTAYGRRLTPFDIFWGGLQKLSVEIKKKNLKLGGIVLIHYFLIHIFLIARAIVRVRPVNFVIQETIGEAWMRILLVVLVTSCAIMAVLSMFVFYSCMIEQKSFSDSMSHSRTIVHRHPVRFVTAIAGSNALVLLLITLFYMLAVVAAGVFVVLFANNRLALALLFSVAGRLDLVALAAGGMLLMIVHFCVLTVMYYQYVNHYTQKQQRDFNYLIGAGISRKRVGLVIGAVMMISLFYISDLVFNGSALLNISLSEIQITAHRGSSKTAPENTMSAIEAAIEEMADYAEIDVQLTADGVVVLGHDSSLRRVAGVNRSIGSMTWEELQQIDVGSWFSDDFSGEAPPSLDEVMEACKGKINLNIEIKNAGKNSELPQKVVELVQQHGMEEQCVVTATSLSYLVKIKELAPEVHTGYIVSAAYGDFYSNDAVDFISIRSNFVTDSLVLKVHEQGKAVHAWTVNSKNEIERMQILKVDNIITDNPVLAREILYREEAAETLLKLLRQVFR